MIILEYIFKIY